MCDGSWCEGVVGTGVRVVWEFFWPHWFPWGMLTLWSYPAFEGPFFLQAFLFRYWGC